MALARGRVQGTSLRALEIFDWIAAIRGAIVRCQIGEVKVRKHGEARLATRRGIMDGWMGAMARFSISSCLGRRFFHSQSHSQSRTPESSARLAGPAAHSVNLPSLARFRVPKGRKFHDALQLCSVCSRTRPGPALICGAPANTTPENYRTPKPPLQETSGTLCLLGPLVLGAGQ